jgi:hypothetical protein
MRKHLGFVVAVLLLFVTISCKREIGASGRVISATDGIPLDNASIDWVNYYKTTVVTDSLGYFSIGDECRCIPDCPKLQVFVREKGYESQYFDLTGKSSPTANNLVLKLKPLLFAPKEFKETRKENLLKSLNALLSLVNIFTLVMIALSSMKEKVLWIVAVVFLSVTIKYNYFNEDTEVYPFSFFVQVRMSYIGWYLFYIPVATISFWLYYFYKKRQGVDLLAKSLK